MLADTVDVVIGVDTHRDRHRLALVAAASGALLAERELSADRRGYRAALRLARARSGRRLWALEGSGCYGAGLARFLAARGECVVEVERPLRRQRSGRLKTDALDALRAARAVLAGEAQATPRAAGSREALRVLLATQEAAVAVRRAGLCQLRALVVTAPEPLRERLRPLGKCALVGACLRLRVDGRQSSERAATALALRASARRVRAASREAEELERELARLVAALAPWLTELPGVGAISAAQLLVAWSHRGRLHSEAAFARLAGWRRSRPVPDRRCASAWTGAATGA
jgi:transposase